MQSRALREGAAGLTIVAGVLVFGGILLWLRGLVLQGEQYRFTAQFPNASGVQEGSIVRYRGTPVGRIVSVKASLQTVDALIEIGDVNLVMPKNVVVEVVQKGLIGDNTVDIVPAGEIPAIAVTAKARDSNCNSQVIICNGSTVPGRVGPNFTELIRKAEQLVQLYTQPELMGNLNTTLRSVSVAAQQIAETGKGFERLPADIKLELSKLSTGANALTASLNQTSNKVGQLSDRATNTLQTFDNTARSFDKTALEINRTATEYRQLAGSVNELVAQNRNSLTQTIGNYNALATDLRRTTTALNPLLTNLNNKIDGLDTQKISRELEGVLANANRTAANLNNISASLNNPNTLVNLQTTLDSARVTFDNTRRITANLDSLVGDPQFVESFRKLVQGLSSLISSTEQIEQQVRLAQSLEPIQTYVNQADTPIAVALNPTFSTRTSIPPSSSPVPSPALSLSPLPSPSIPTIPAANATFPSPLPTNSALSSKELDRILGRDKPSIGTIPSPTTTPILPGRARF
jgi:phospholipid/cholesterol/gamma-HCH transport system substrate-binding protein